MDYSYSNRPPLPLPVSLQSLLADMSGRWHIFHSCPLDVFFFSLPLHKWTFGFSCMFVFFLISLRAVFACFFYHVSSIYLCICSSGRAQEEETDQDQLFLRHFSLCESTRMCVFVCVCASSAFATSPSKVGGHLCGRTAVVETLPLLWQFNVITFTHTCTETILCV